MPAEVRIREQIVKAIKKRGGRPIKYYGCVFSEAGVPDLLVCYRGQFVFLEIKKPGEKATRKQLQVIDELYQAGAIGGIVMSVNAAILFLDEVDNMYGDT